MSPLEQCRVKVLSTFAGVLREKIGTRAIFTKILANYILEEGLITADCDKKYNLTCLSAFLSWKCQGPVGVKRPKVFLLNLSGIGCVSTSKMAAQSYFKKKVSS